MSIERHSYEKNALDNGNSVKNALVKRRVLDDLLEERRLQRNLRDYDYDLD
jgi:hypothetical protein